MVKWKDKRNPDPFVNKMELARSIKEDGKVQFSGNDIFTVPIQLENIVELNPIITQEDKHIIVWNALRNAGRKGVLTSNSVLTEIIQLEKEFLSTKEQKFILISTLSINSRKHILPNTQINHCHISFSLKNATKYINHINSNRNITYYIDNNKIPSDYTWVMITVLAKSIYAGFQKAVSSLNLYRGILNFLINFGRRSYSFGSNKPKPINRIRFGPIHTLHKPNGELVGDIFWFEEEYFDLNRAYEENIVGNFPKVLNYFSKIRKQLNISKIKDILEDAISLYSSALDSYSFDTAFIKLWATLELLTGSGYGNYDVTIRRTSFIFKDNETTKSLLKILRDCRNDIVHKGSMEGKKEILLYDLKLYVERLIHFLLWNTNGINDFEEIKELLDSCPNKQKLERKLKINKKALKLYK